MSGKRTQWIGILTFAGGLINIVIKLLNGGGLTAEDFALITTGGGLFTLGQKVDRK